MFNIFAIFSAYIDETHDKKFNHLKEIHVI